MGTLRFGSVGLLVTGLLGFSGLLWGGATCYPAGGKTVITDWNDPLSWAGLPEGSGGTCQAAGGLSISFRGKIQPVEIGVPGAANQSDHVVITSGHEAHVTFPVQLGDPTLLGGGNGITVLGTSMTNYGALVIDDRAMLMLRGFSNARSANNSAVADLQRYGVFQVMPGGTLIVDTAVNLQGEFSVGGRFYSGCGDPATAASPFCTSNSGGWVRAVAGSPGSFVSSAMPQLRVGDLVEITTTPQPVVTGSGAVGPPYAAIGKIPPSPATPVPTLPATNTGLIPDGFPLCVVSVNPLMVAFPTNPATETCTTSSTPLDIVDAGRGQLWLKKPAFISGNPSRANWASHVNLDIAVAPFAFGGTDAMRTWIALPNAPFSNSTHNGPGRPGDTSFVPTSISVTSLHGYSCFWISDRKNRFEDVQTCGDYYLDEASGQFCVFGGSALLVQLKADVFSLAEPNIRNVTFQTVPGGPWEGNEMLLENTTIRHMVGTTIPAFSISNYSSSVPGAHFRFEGNTVKTASGLIQTNNLTGTANDPIPFRNNAFFESPEFLLYGISANIGSAYVDISNNYMSNRMANITTTARAGLQDNPHWSVTNNVGNVAVLMVTATSAVNTENTFSDLLFQRNRLMYMGYPVTGFFNGNWQGPGGTKDHPARFQWNYMYGSGRCAFVDKYTITDHNLCAWAIHHGYVINSQNGQTTPMGGNHIPGVVFEYNLNVEKQLAGGSAAFFEIGYNFASWVDAPIIRNNTSTGNSQGGIGLGDIGDGGTIGLLSNATIVDNLLVSDEAKVGVTYTTGFGFAKTISDSLQNLNQTSILQAGNNIIAGPGPAYVGATRGASPNMTNKSFNRFTKVTHNGGVLYNNSPTRNVTGVMIQNPTYSSLSGASLQLNVNSPSDITGAWNDGTGFGAPTQLNWAGAGVTFPITDAIGQNAFAKLSIAGSWGGGDFLAGCPQANWLRIISGPGAGKTYAIMRCATDQLAVVPDATKDGVTAGSVAVIMSTEVRLNNAANNGYVDLGIDPSNLPATSKTDTGISLALTDYCPSGCARYVDPQILGNEANTPNSFLWEQTASPVFPIALPLANSPTAGYPMEYAWTGPMYRPSAAAATASTTGGCVGAVSCDGLYGDPQTISFTTQTSAVWGTGAIALSATASSGLPVTFGTTTPTVCAVTGSSVAIVAVGTCIVTADQTGGFNFRAAPQVTSSINIIRATPVITWATPAAIFFGTTLTATQLNATASVPGTLVYTPAAGTVPAVGTQTLSVTFTPTDSAHYTTATKAVSLTVNPITTTTGAPVLVISKSLARDASRNIVVTLTIANSGGDARNVNLTTATLNGISGALIPRSLGVIAARTSVQVIITFPASTGITGGSANAVFSGNYTGGTFSNTSRTVLP